MRQRRKHSGYERTVEQAMSELRDVSIETTGAHIAVTWQKKQERWCVRVANKPFTGSNLALVCDMARLYILNTRRPEPEHKYTIYR